jgi:outer membrane lipoprotein
MRRNSPLQRGPATSLLLVAGLLGGCATSELPATVLENTEKVAFSQLAQNPSAYEGQRIILGGEVIHAKLLPDRTEIEVLELPLDSTDEPTRNRAASQGRFLAYQTKDFLDPAILPPGTRVTIVGKGKAALRKQMDEAEYTYPVIESDYLKIWPVRMFDRSYPYGYGPYYYWPYGDPWYPYYHGYYGPYPFFPFIVVPHRHHTHHVSPSSSVPSHFGKGRHR